MTGPLKVRIRLGPTGNDGSVEIDGKDMSHHIKGVQINSVVGNMTEVLLAFVDVDVEIDGLVDSTGMGTDWVTYRLGRVIRDEMQAASAAEGAPV